MNDYFMQRALSLAQLARGRTSPNPMVGAVIVKDGRIVGEGYHHRAGEPHAEIHALRQAGEAARAAVLQRLVIRLCRLTRRGRVPFVKEALNALGQDVGGAVSPLRPLSVDERGAFVPELLDLVSEAEKTCEEGR